MWPGLWLVAAGRPKDERAEIGELGAAHGLERAAALDRVESSKSRSSLAPGRCAAKTPISHSIVSANRARRLCRASWLGKAGNRWPSWRRAARRKRRSLGIPINT